MPQRTDNNTLTGSISAKEKILVLYLIEYTTASTAEFHSVTLGLRVSVQPAKPASPIKLLCEELLKVYVFSAHKIFTTLSAPFANKISHFKILAIP